MADPHDPDSLTNKKQTKTQQQQKKLERTFRKEYMKKTAVYNVVGPLFIYIYTTFIHIDMYFSCGRKWERGTLRAVPQKKKIK